MGVLGTRQALRAISARVSDSAAGANLSRNIERAFKVGLRAALNHSNTVAGGNSEADAKNGVSGSEGESGSKMAGNGLDASENAAIARLKGVRVRELSVSDSSDAKTKNSPSLALEIVSFINVGKKEEKLF